MRDVIAPEALAEAVAASGFSPAVRAGDLIFLTGATGGTPGGKMPDTALAQLDAILTKLDTILNAANLPREAVVEMTSYHLHPHLRDTFDALNTRLREVLGTPLPAWTAVEVAGLRRPGALLEIRFILHAPTTPTP
ncbi:MAG: Rid family hydrolase [Pseudomonadota bacterium]